MRWEVKEKKTKMRQFCTLVNSSTSKPNINLEYFKGKTSIRNKSFFHQYTPPIIDPILLRSINSILLRLTFYCLIRYAIRLDF